MSKDHIHLRLALTDAMELSTLWEDELNSLAADADGTADGKIGFLYRLRMELDIAVDHRDDYSHKDEHKD